MPHPSSARAGSSFSFIEWDAALESPMSQLADDGRGTRELDPAGPKKSKEEIEALSVDDSLGEIDRSLLLLTRQPIQRFSVLLSFSRIASEEPKPAFSVLFPAILKAAMSPANEPEFLRAAGAFLLDALRTYQETHSSVVQVHELSKLYMNNPDEALRQLYSELYLSTLSSGLPSSILCQVIDNAKNNSNLTQPVAKRVWCARVLGNAAVSITPNLIVNVIMEKALSLCQDTDQEVRKKMALEICKISVALEKIGEAAISMKEFSELCVDEEPTVRASSLLGVSSHLSELSSESKFKWVLPAVLSALEDPAMLEVLSQEFGHILWFCREQFNAEQLEALSSFFKRLAISNVEDIRLRCVYNLPAVTRVLGQKVANVANGFSRDSSPAVRRKLAGCMHNLAEYLSPNSVSILLNSFLTQLGDEKSIFITVAAELDKIFTYFYAEGTPSKKVDLSDALFLIMRRMREAVSHSNWRDVELVMSKMKQICELFSSDQINEICSPLFLRVLHESPMIPLRHSAIKVLVRQLRRLRRAEQRETMVKTLIGESNLTTGFKAKIQFLNLCNEVLLTCSSRMFRIYFAAIFLNLSTDKIKCVHRKWLEVAPLALAALRVPQLESSLAKKVGEVIEELSKSSILPDVFISGPLELMCDRTRETEEGFQPKNAASDENRRKEFLNSSAAGSQLQNSANGHNSNAQAGAAATSGGSPVSSTLSSAASGRRTGVLEKKDKKSAQTTPRPLPNPTSSVVSTAAAVSPATAASTTNSSSVSQGAVQNSQVNSSAAATATVSINRRESSSKSHSKASASTLASAKSSSSTAPHINYRNGSNIVDTLPTLGSSGSLAQNTAKAIDEHPNPFLSMPRRSSKDSSGQNLGQPRCSSPTNTKNSSMITSAKRAKDKEKRGAGSITPAK